MATTSRCLNRANLPTILRRASTVTVAEQARPSSLQVHAANTELCSKLENQAARNSHSEAELPRTFKDTRGGYPRGTVMEDQEEEAP